LNSVASRHPRGSVYRAGYSQFCRDIQGEESEQKNGLSKVNEILKDFEIEESEMDFGRNDDPMA